ncbi:MAG: hypothetical protein HC769_28825 [Cyanobacteria bacterium CRU_2_1]|nr:hypothetical protein [Cyanobacteria bacterium RU_5_0]NJR62457.1 hypothetical protein [Cyanobacteria bacterium CRU_2_1]
MAIFDPNANYTFRNYFDLGIPAKDIARAFDYQLSRVQLELPQALDPIDWIEEVRSRITRVLPYVELNNEVARREVVIAPVLTELSVQTRAELRIEYDIRVSNQLQGTLDYLFEQGTRLLVVEAKQADLTREFAQLTAELIALDRFTESPEDAFVGAVTTGITWQFGRLHRREKTIEQGLNSYRVPEDLEPLIRILLAVLIGTN